MKRRRKQVQERLSPTEAVRVLLPAHHRPHAAADRITMAMRGQDCSVWCDGRLVPADYAARMLEVEIRTKRGGNWEADVVSSKREGWNRPSGSYDFRFDADEVRALLPSLAIAENPSQRGKPGPKPKDEWPKLVAAKMVHLALNDPEVLQNADALVRSMKKFLEDEIGWAPKDPKDLRREILTLLQFVRR